MGVTRWGVLRCPTCEKRRSVQTPNGHVVEKWRPRILCRYKMGGLTTGGNVEIKCVGCKKFLNVTYENQYGDDVSTFTDDHVVAR